MLKVLQREDGRGFKAFAWRLSASLLLFPAAFVRHACALNTKVMDKR